MSNYKKFNNISTTHSNINIVNIAYFHEGQTESLSYVNLLIDVKATRLKLTIDPDTLLRRYPGGILCDL